MSKLNLASMLFVAFVFGCSSTPPADSPPKAEPGPEPELSEPKVDAPDENKPEVDKPDEADVDKPDVDAPDEDQPEVSKAPPPPKKEPCVGLKQSTCKVTAGCAWHSTKNSCIVEDGE